jgi:hypothetical protein
MNAVELRGITRRRILPSWGTPSLAVALLAVASPIVIAAAEPDATVAVGELQTEDEGEDVTKMAAFNVQADRVEEFGFRVGVELRNPFGSATPIVRAIYPNTAAAKAGLRPGDRVVKTDGASAAVTLFSLSKWSKLSRRKWAEIAAGKKSVTWTLDVESWDQKEKRTVKMEVPTAPPRWGASKWQPPAGRTSAVVEPGPLADLAREMLGNGIWVVARGVALLGFERKPEPWLGYEWLLTTTNVERHRLFVTQQRGRTEMVFDRSGGGQPGVQFLTSPNGALEKWHRYRQRGEAKFEEMALEEAREAFQREIDFWTKEVGRVTGRWPFEWLKTEAPGANIAAGAASAPRPAADTIAMGQRADTFLKLTPATEAQKALFAEALGKLGADAERWAYTETARGLEDSRVTVVRVDPGKSDAERCTLLKLDGKAPKPADVKRWREEGRDVSPSLGDLPPIAGLVDVNDVRVFAEETASIVFELPLRGGNAQFPAEKFQALFRVNKTHRGFEDFVVKMRESFRVAKVVSVTEAGITARFQTLDPRYAPQPVYLKAGGAVRVLLVKFARSFESTRTDFQAVTPPLESVLGEPVRLPTL